MLSTGGSGMAQKLPDVFSTHSAAKFCRVTPMTIIRWIDEGRIKAYKTPGGHRRIMRADLEDFCRRNQIPMQWEDRVDAGTQRVLIVDDDPSVVESKPGSVLRCDRHRHVG